MREYTSIETVVWWLRRVRMNVPETVLRELPMPALVTTLVWAYCEHQVAQGDAFCRTQPLPPWLEPFCAPSVEAVEAGAGVAVESISHEQRVCVQVCQSMRYPGVL